MVELVLQDAALHLPSQVAAVKQSAGLVVVAAVADSSEAGTRWVAPSWAVSMAVVGTAAEACLSAEVATAGRTGVLLRWLGLAEAEVETLVEVLAVWPTLAEHSYCA